MSDSLTVPAEPKKGHGISAFTLKMIAIITMLIDHTAAAMIENETNYFTYRSLDITLREIGRIAFPIFCFQIAEGAARTKNKPRYAARLLLFGLISELPFDMALMGSNWNYSHNNVFFTLFFGLIAIYFLQLFPWEETMKPKAAAAKPAENVYVQAPESVETKITEKKPEEHALPMPKAAGPAWFLALPVWPRRILSVAGAVLCAVVAWVLHTDYDWFGVTVIALIYVAGVIGDRKRQCIVGAVSFFWELTAPLAFIPVYFYNGKYGIRNKFTKYFFYAFYPAHLAILAIVRKYLGI